MKVSVVIPIYNVEAYVEDCLESVRKQTLEDIEMICINDKGTDHSFDIVREIAKRDKRIRLYENERNIGLAATRNRGITLARGKYIYFLDSDDMITENAMEHLYQKAEAGQLDAVVFCSRFIYDNKELEEKFHSNPSVFKRDYGEVINGKDLYVKWMECWDWMPSQPRYFYNLNFLKDNEIWFVDGILHEDESFAFDVLMKAKAVHVCNEPYFIRRFRNNSIMTQKPSMKNVIGCVSILQHISGCREWYMENDRLKEAVHFYRKKITTDVKKKFVNAGFQGNFRIGEELPFLSVIIPVYNVAPYLEECMESILSQNFIDYEIICVDDGSTDGSLDLLLEYEKTDPRIFVYQNEENMGQAYARNIGLSHARGTYVYMMDADDLLSPGSFQILTSLCRQSDLSVIAFENQQFTQEDCFWEQSQVPLFTYEKVEGIYSGKDAFMTCVNEDVISPSVPTYLIKRECIEKNHLRFEEGILHEDIGFIFALLMSCEKVQLLHKALYYRRFRSASTVTGVFSAKNVEGYLKSWQKAFSSPYVSMEKDTDLYQAYRKWIRDVLGRIRMLYLQNESRIYQEEGGFVDVESRLLLEMLKETTTGRCRAEMILGKELAALLEKEGRVYLCGSGQYLNRMIDVIGALDVEIIGIINAFSKDKKRKAYRGFRMSEPDFIEDKNIPVVMAMSHYNYSACEELLKKWEFTNLLQMKF